MQKARRQPCGLRLLVSMRFQVLFHSPHRGSFHLSLTVLVHYRSLESIEPYRMVPANSRKIPRVPRYSGAKLEVQIFAYATITLYGRLFHTFLLIVLFRYV
jgi:hypothetical protein